MEPPDIGSNSILKGLVINESPSGCILWGNPQKVKLSYSLGQTDVSWAETGYTTLYGRSLTTDIDDLFIDAGISGDAAAYNYSNWFLAQRLSVVNDLLITIENGCPDGTDVFYSIYNTTTSVFDVSAMSFLEEGIASLFGGCSVHSSALPSLSIVRVGYKFSASVSLYTISG